MKNDSISLCMIVKDEEENLPRCLQSVKSVVDEIVIADTGSTDRSKEIAASFGAKIFSFEWRDDFSAARNFSLQNASGKWILWLDADEALEEGFAFKVRSELKKENIAGLHFPFVNVYKDRHEPPTLFLRMFLRHPEISWVNVIHEQILGSVQKYANKNNLAIGTCPAKIFHFGYSDSEMRKKGKYERNLKLFQKQLEQYPDDPYSWYQLAVMVRQKDTLKSRQAMTNTVRLLRLLNAEQRKEAVYAADAFAHLATSFEMEGNPEAANELLEEARKTGYLLTPNFYYGAATILLKQKNYSGAIDHFTVCRKLDGRALTVPIQWGITGPLALQGKAECYLQLGKTSEAEKALDEAVGLAPHHLPLVLTAAHHFLKAKKTARALEFLNNYLQTNPEPSDLWDRAGKPILQIVQQAAEKIAVR